MTSSDLANAPLKSICAIIVNYGTPELTIKGVESILAGDHGARHVDIAVVDNASPDDSAAQLRAAHADKGWGDRVTLFLETENHGFGRGNNVVFDKIAEHQTPTDAVFLLNPDAFLDNNAIDILAQALEADPKAGFAGAGIKKPDGTAVTAAFRFPSFISEFSAALNFGPVSRACARWTVPLRADHPAGPVDWVAGAAVMMRMQALQDIGTFDPNFFLYYEEVELMRRGSLNAWSCLYVPSAQVIHIEGEATGVKSGRPIAKRVPSFRYDAWQYYFRKCHGRPMALLTAFGMVIGSAGNRVISKVRGRPSSVASHFFQDFLRHSVKPLLTTRTGKN